MCCQLSQLSEAIAYKPPCWRRSTKSPGSDPSCSNSANMSPPLCYSPAVHLSCEDCQARAEVSNFHGLAHWCLHMVSAVSDLSQRPYRGKKCARSWQFFQGVLGLHQFALLQEPRVINALQLIRRTSEKRCALSAVTAVSSD